MPPSAMTCLPTSRATAAHSPIAVSCGTPVPATIRVVQIDPGPTPTFTTSAPASKHARAASGVAMLPATTVSSGYAAFTAVQASSTPLECPWAVSMTTRSTPASTRALRRASRSPPTPMAAPTTNRP